MGTFRRHFITLFVILFSLIPVHGQRSAEAMHVVLPGETLGLIAERYGLNIFELAALNGISNAHFIYSWQQLTLPSGSLPTLPVGEALGTHIVQLGETLDSIATLYGIDLIELQALNNIWSYLIYPGDELALPVAGRAPAPPETEPIVEPADERSPIATSEYAHEVQIDETLGTIAADYGVSLFDLQEINEIWTYLIYPGQQLLIPAGGTPPADKPENTPEDRPPAIVSPAPVTRQPETHKVERGDTLFSIAQTYGVQVDLLMSANGITDPQRLHAGLVLRVADLESAIPPQQATSTIPVPSVARDQYTVLPGEFLSTIGNKLGMSWLAIAAVNGIGNPDSLYAGTVLQVPTQEEAARYGPLHPARVDPGAHIGVGRELVVVLSTQSAYAYENGILQKSAIVSTGLPATPTVQGDYKIYLKRPSRHMVGPGYDLPNVLWVSYFYQGYAFHGTYWHNNFGTPMSHGCVNMTDADAKWFYDFAPIGTPVHVRFY